MEFCLFKFSGNNQSSPTVKKPDTMALMGIDSVCVFVTPFGLHFCAHFDFGFSHCTFTFPWKEFFEGAGG